MGVYYQYENLDAKECISLHYVANIKYGAYEVPGIHAAILNIFLGFDPNRTVFNIPYVGIWRGHRISLTNDTEEDYHPKYIDKGMEMIKYLHANNCLDVWLLSLGREAPIYDSVVRGIAAESR